MMSLSGLKNFCLKSTIWLIYALQLIFLVVSIVLMLFLMKVFIIVRITWLIFIELFFFFSIMLILLNKRRVLGAICQKLFSYQLKLHIKVLSFCFFAEYKHVLEIEIANNTFCIDILIVICEIISIRIFWLADWTIFRYWSISLVFHLQVFWSNCWFYC